MTPFSRNLQLQYIDSLTTSPAKTLTIYPSVSWQFLKTRQFQLINCDGNITVSHLRKASQFQSLTFTCVLGKADVRSVSWVSSAGFLLGTLNTKAAWSQVAAVDVMRYPLSHRLWMPSLGYKKSNSTTWRQKHQKMNSAAVMQSKLYLTESQRDIKRYIPGLKTLHCVTWQRPSDYLL